MIAAKAGTRDFPGEIEGVSRENDALAFEAATRHDLGRRYRQGSFDMPLSPPGTPGGEEDRMAEFLFRLDQEGMPADLPTIASFEACGSGLGVIQPARE